MKVTEHQSTNELVASGHIDEGSDLADSLWERPRSQCSIGCRQRKSDILSSFNAMS